MQCDFRDPLGPLCSTLSEFLVQLQYEYKCRSQAFWPPGLFAATNWMDTGARIGGVIGGSGLETQDDATVQEKKRVEV